MSDALFSDLQKSPEAETEDTATPASDAEAKTPAQEQETQEQKTKPEVPEAPQAATEAPEALEAPESSRAGTEAPESPQAGTEAPEAPQEATEATEAPEAPRAGTEAPEAPQAGAQEDMGADSQEAIQATQEAAEDALQADSQQQGSPRQPPPPPVEHAVGEAAYRVLARKYRPQNFDLLLGQEALVRTLRNAIESGRIPQAILLTGVRGVGKTTTARLIARAVNYTGADGTAGPTFAATDDCEVCRTIAAERHVDVVEMDAASRTGVADIRELIDAARYRPTSARYKVYIIDEVHMLSVSAFNALLKTLEEPPAHLLFVFATTEVRKLPVTVLSRCMRFDLRRLSRGELAQHFAWVCAQEGVKAEAEALSAIARAAEGSVRDGLSLLDQAIAMGAGEVALSLTHEMLGLADRNRVADLLLHALSGEVQEMLTLLRRLHSGGAMPETILTDLLELTHAATLFLATGSGEAEGIETPVLENLARGFSMPEWGRTWQILLKGSYEVRGAPRAESALEMLLLRLAYGSDLPDPATLVRRLRDLEKSGGAGSNGATGAGAGAQAKKVGSEALPHESALPPDEPCAESPQTLAQVRDILRDCGKDTLALDLERDYALVSLSASGGKGHLVLSDLKSDNKLHGRNFGTQLMMYLAQATGDKWLVDINSDKGATAIAQSLNAEEQARQAEYLKSAQEWQIVRTVLEHFPEARVVRVSESEAPRQGESVEQEVAEESADALDASDASDASDAATVPNFARGVAS